MVEDTSHMGMFGVKDLRTGNPLQRPVSFLINSRALLRSFSEKRNNNMNVDQSNHGTKLCGAPLIGTLEPGIKLCFGVH